MTNHTPAIEARSLTKRFGNFLAVDAVDFNVREGELFGFLGPNGAGKTTTINMLTGLARPTGGTIRYSCRNVVDFGCGYGTFIIPAAQVVQGTVHALDIEAEMVEATARKASQFGLTNVHVEQRDFVTHGTGLPDGSIDFAMLFNILHCEEPQILPREAHRTLSAGGRLAIMH